MKTADLELIDRLASSASRTPRGRTNHNFHADLDDPIQRMLNVMRASSYVRPHLHAEPGRWELFAVLIGRSTVLTFDDIGTVTEQIDLSRRGPTWVAEIPAGVWHTIIALESPTVFLEVKPGPYRPLSETELAPWAPAEGAAERDDFVRWLSRARAGDRFP